MAQDGTRKVYVKSYGCQMNVYDASAWRTSWRREGYAETADMDDADLVVLNTCHIREKAAEKVYSELGRVRRAAARRAPRPAARRDRRRRLRRPGRGRGDPAPRDGRRPRRRAAELSPPARAARAGRRAQRRASSTPSSRPRTSSTTCRAASREKTPARGVSAFLTVQEGCDKFCAFCVVPYTRGAEVSRPVAHVIARGRAPRRRRRARGHAARPERQRLSRRRAGRRGVAAGALLRAARRACRARAAALHHQPSPRHGRRADRRPSRPAGADALSAPAGAVGLGPHARRDEPPPHRATTICASSSAIRAARPDIALSSDFIVGFPGETDADFERDDALVERGRLRRRLSFKYPPAPRHARRRHGRPGAGDVKAERLQRLQALLDRQLRAFNARHGRPDASTCCWSEPGRHPGQLVGTLALSAGRAGRGPPAPRSATSCRSRIVGDGHAVACIGAAGAAREPERTMALKRRGSLRSAEGAHAVHPPAAAGGIAEAAEIKLAFEDNRLASLALRPVRPEPRASSSAVSAS